MTKPLDGIKIVDLSTILAGPMISSLLAEFGADVIKVEQPLVGDPSRHYPPSVDGIGVGWSVYGRNRRGVTADLHEPEGRDIVLRLVAEADMVVSNFRPSTLRRFGLDFDDLRAVRDDIVLVHLTAFGRTGPYAERPGFARVVEAFAGLTYRSGEPDGPPMFSGYAIADGVGGMYGAFTAMLALRQRDLTGDPQLVDLALYEPMLRMMEDFLAAYDLTGEVAERCGNANPAICPNGLFRTADDRWLVLAASTEQMWRRLLPLLERPDLAALDSNTERVHQRELVEGAVAAFASSRKLDELLELLDAAGVAAGPVNTAADLFADPHIRARQSLVRVPDPARGKGSVTMQAPAGRFSGFTGSIDQPAPTLGQHTDEVLSGLGFDPVTLADLRDRHII